MRCRVIGEGLDRKFVAEDVRDNEVASLAALGFTVHGRTALRAIDGHSRHVDEAFANLARHLPTMVDQHRGAAPVPWEDCLMALLDRIRDRGIRWALIGTAALAVRGIEVRPGDIDIVTDEAGAAALAERCRDVLVFPVVDWPGLGLFGRAFSGARLEWLANEPWWQRCRETVSWRGSSIAVLPVSEQLDIERRRGRGAYVTAIERFAGTVHGETPD